MLGDLAAESVAHRPLPVQRRVMCAEVPHQCRARVDEMLAGGQQHREEVRVGALGVEGVLLVKALQAVQRGQLLGECGVSAVQHLVSADAAACVARGR